jgi:hypothetical protein
MGDLKEDSRSVSGFHVPADCTAVLQVAQGADGLPDDLVGFPAVDLSDESYTTGVMFVAGIVEGGTVTGIAAPGWVVLHVLNLPSMHKLFV